MLNNSEKSSPLSRFLYLLEWEDIEAVNPLSNRTAASQPAFRPVNSFPLSCDPFSLFLPALCTQSGLHRSCGGAEGEGFTHEWIEQTDAKGF